MLIEGLDEANQEHDVPFLPMLMYAQGAGGPYEFALALTATTLMVGLIALLVDRMGKELVTAARHNYSCAL